MPFFIFSFAKFYSFRNFMQTTERKNFGKNHAFLFRLVFVVNLYIAKI